MRRGFCVMLAVLILWTACACAATLPSGMLTVEEEAFAGVPVTEFILPEGLRTIAARAFSSAALRHVILPPSVSAIDNTAFEGVAADFFATVIEGSYAETWCRTHGVSYSYGSTPYVTPAVTALSVSLQGDKYLGTPYSVMDCQAFVEACLFDAGINLNLAGSNAWYRRMDWVGTPEECIAVFGSIPKGAFLYIHAFDGGEPAYYKDDLGNASHIGIYTGTQSGAMAASSKRGEVIYSYFAGATVSGSWNCVGLWRQLDYGETINRRLQKFY